MKVENKPYEMNFQLGGLLQVVLGLKSLIANSYN
jgi:hypothetical protein